MNKEQKQVQQALLNNEKEVLEALKQNYEDALLGINSNLQYLMNREDADMQHVIYQAEYQRALKDQIEGILNQLNNNEFETVSEYLTQCYEDGFVGTMYDLQSQGIPLIFPIDQEKVVQAIQHDTKLSTNLYSAFDMKALKKNIAGEISRGISSAATYNEIARNISGHANVNLNNAMRIARTEGHRINIKSSMDAQQKAREKGADIVKQWDASLDGKTRPHHRELDGQIRELDEDFEYSGGTVSAPSHFGIPSEDINCRCVLLQRARWALGEDITKYSPDAVEKISDDGATKLFKIKAKDYQDFKKQYFKEIDEKRVRSNAQKMNDLLLRDKPNINMSAKQKYQDTVTVADAYMKLPTKVKSNLPDVVFEFGHNSSACDTDNKIIHVGIGTKESHVHHEYGHLIECYMMNKDDVDDYKKYLTEGLTIDNIKQKKYHDNLGNTIVTFVLDGDRFETEYQSRLYVDKPSDALNPDGTINIDVLGECISEPFEKYMSNKKISDKAMKLIKGTIL